MKGSNLCHLPLSISFCSLSSLPPPPLSNTHTHLLLSPPPSFPDLDASRLAVAKKLGADHTVQVTTRDSRELSRIITGQLGCEADQTIECSGAEPSVATAIYVRESLLQLLMYYIKSTDMTFGEFWYHLYHFLFSHTYANMATKECRYRCDMCWQLLIHTI